MEKRSKHIDFREERKQFQRHIREAYRRCRLWRNVFHWRMRPVNEANGGEEGFSNVDTGTINRIGWIWCSGG